VKNAGSRREASGSYESRYFRPFAIRNLSRAALVRKIAR
jgi:hypothetical protein